MFGFFSSAGVFLGHRDIILADMTCFWQTRKFLADICTFLQVALIRRVGTQRQLAYTHARMHASGASQL